MLQGLDQGLGVDQAAPGDVDQPGLPAHRAEHPPVEQVVGLLGQGGREHHPVGLADHLAQQCRRDRGGGPGHRGAAAVHGGDLGLERLQQPGQRPPDATGADDQHPGPLEAASRNDLGRGPRRGLHVVVQAAGGGEHEGEGVLGHGGTVDPLRRGPRAGGLELVGEGLDAGERELYPGGRRPGQDRRQVIGGHGIGPDQALGLRWAPEDPAGPGHRLHDLGVADRGDRHDRRARFRRFGGHVMRVPVPGWILLQGARVAVASRHGRKLPLPPTGRPCPPR